MRKRQPKRIAEVVPAWHPDFRNLNTLPDVKVVRTSFYVNVGAVLLFVAVFAWAAMQEWQRSTLRFEIEGLEAKIAENRLRNDEVLRLHREFEAEKRVVDSALAHVESSVEFSHYLMALAAILPEEMRFRSIRLQSRGTGDSARREFRIQGEIAATPDEAAGILTSYVNSFVQDAFLGERVEEAVPTSLVASPEGKELTFGIQVILRGDEKKEEKKGGGK